MPARLAASAAHAMVTVPTAGATLTNSSGAGVTGGLENIGTATSSTYTMTETITCTETVAAPIPPGPSPVPGSYDGLETAAGPMIAITNITLPTPWTVPATSKSESLSGLGTAANNTSAGTYDIFPNVKITLVQGVDSSIGSGVGSQMTTATITGPVTELDDWVVPWTPSDAPPFFDGSDFGLARSSGYGNTAKGGPGVFYITFTLKFFTAPFSDGPSPMTPVELDFKIGVINNYDNDREKYIKAYQDAYSALTKVPELSEWQT
jgi:hypothetical protein